MTGRGVRCYNYHFRYLYFSNRMCSLGSKTWAKVKAKRLFAVQPTSSWYLGNGQRAAAGGVGQGRVQELGRGCKRALWQEGGHGDTIQKKKNRGFGQLRRGREGTERL